MTVIGSVLVQASKQARRTLHRSDARRVGVALAVAVTCTALLGS